MKTLLNYLNAAFKIIKTPCLIGKNMNTISNYCRFIGRLTEDPKMVEFDNTRLWTFSLAITEYRREKMEKKRKQPTSLILKLGIPVEMRLVNIAPKAI